MNKGTSGSGSIGKLRDWKWDIISQHAGVIDSVIDVGCGDLSFWEGRSAISYTGIDISPTIIEKNKLDRTNWQFICSSADIYHPLNGRIVFCLDVLFHITDDEVFNKILINLSKYSTEWIFIYTWAKNPLKGFILNRDRNTDGVYQKYRDFSQYLDVISSAEFKLISVEKTILDPIGSMYIFRKQAL